VAGSLQRAGIRAKAYHAGLANDVRATARTRRGLDLEGAAAVAGPAPCLLGTGPPRDDLDPRGDHEGGIEADAELTDQVGVLARIARQAFQELRRTGARDGAEIAGYAYASPFRPRSGYRFTIEDSIYVRHDMHGRGVGSLLMSHLLPACKATGARQVIAVIGDTLNAGSIGVHAKFGFVHAGTIPGAGFKLGRWVDLVFMHKALNGGTETLPTGPGAWTVG
jgi:L-amino acid N-acyltransferase YncA